MLLCRSIGGQAWDDNATQLAQLDGIGVVALRKLVGAGVKTVEELEDLDSFKIEGILSKNPPYGTNLLSQVKGFPKLRVSLKAVGQPVSLLSRLSTSNEAC